MNKPNFTKIARSVQTTVSKHSPEILTGMGIAGMIATTVMVAHATPKALTILDEAINEKEEWSYPQPTIKDLPKMFTLPEVIKLTWKCYIPAAVTGSLSIACLIGASAANVKRNAALATAYTISEAALKDYQEKVVETIGEKKEQVVKDKVAKERVDKDPVSNHEVIITEKGNTLCYDVISGRYFKSDIEKIRRAENYINKRLMNEMWVSLNEFYYELGLSGTSVGDQLGWDIDYGFIELSFSTQLAEDDTPCIVVDYLVAPKYRKYN